MLRVTDKHVFFWSEWPSNFCKTHFKWEAFGEEHEFFCTEQAFMWAKAKFFKDEETAKKILAEETEPMVCKHLGREVKNYVDSEWEKVRYDMMLKPNIERFWQDKLLQKKIIDPKFDGLTFVEASPYDKIWGVGLKQDDPKIDDERNWRGRNLLGKVITETRDEILKRLAACYAEEEENKRESKEQ